MKRKRKEYTMGDIRDLLAKVCILNRGISFDDRFYDAKQVYRDIISMPLLKPPHEKKDKTPGAKRYKVSDFPDKAWGDFYNPLTGYYEGGRRS